jgi:hemerythrin-like domain-containing protein
VHFADEDRLFSSLPVAQDSLNRLDKEHVELRALILQVIDGPFSAEDAARAGKLLDAHIRWEEHELFPQIETTLTRDELERLAKETTTIENSRHRSL